MSVPTPSEPTTDIPPTHAVVDLLGLVALGELLAFERMAADARLAPDLRRRAALGEMAAAEIGNYRRLAARIAALGALPDDAMARYVTPLQAYHDSTEPRDWAEAVTKAYVGDGITDDFLREIAGALAEPDRRLVLDVLHESRYADFAATEIRIAVEADPRVADRLSMWARRLVGEALSQAGRVASADRGALTALTGPGEQVDVPGLFRRLTAAHTARMAAVGLNN
ncbi:ferritin-like fold-containing protein [Micromonospora endolithica]|uniref:Hydroxylase n=1 Tax=Micromonospora endolithica TaxID=230091 RepID=A0A3A9Z7M6_9ACTN|nr:ferritin-like fold-containing protein [Micromonospora endolithica]RKN44270.1 hydroxylase [Micromonospora endolithica]TWJ25739.1 tRNA-(MS[2]IO[6]A)-hydroxylase MiaE-like protein [Micromonospora endolithica]